MEQILRLNDALYNAGLLGFLRVLKAMDPQMETPTGMELKVDFAVFEDEKFTKAYFGKLLDLYKKQTKYQALMDEMKPYIDGCAVSDAKDKEYKAFVKSVKAKLDSASYKAAYEIIANDSENPFAFVPLIQRWKSANGPEAQNAILPELYEKLRQYGDIFALKDIIYNFVQPYWSGVSFLHKTKNKTPFIEAFEENFIVPIRTYKPKRGKKVYHCLQCGAALPGAPSNSGMAWINDTGVDIKRKTNGFWNFNVDFAPCPLCNLIYACIPLGFQTMAYEGVFINGNGSYSQLERMNSGLDIENTQQGSFAVIINQFLAEADQKEAKRKLDNIQVIRRSRKDNGEWEYRVNIFSAELLKNLSDCKESLQWLAEHTPWLHRMVINTILDGKNVYPLLYRQYREALKEKRSLNLYFNVLRIQIAMFHVHTGKGNKMEKKTMENYIFQARKEGRELQAEMESRINDKKGITLSYGLLNALQTGDSNQFFQLVMRRYLSMGKPIPDLFIQIIQNEEAFQAIGNAFLIGLSQGNVQKNNEEAAE